MDKPERLERLRNRVIRFLRQERPDQLDSAMAHMSYCACLAGLLAMRSGCSAELCQAAGYLHDVWLYLYAPCSPEDLTRHGPEGAALAPKFLTPDYTQEEIDIICRMIANHDNHDIVDDAYSEILKDADMLSHHISFCRSDTAQPTHPRVRPLGEALGFSVE